MKNTKKQKNEHLIDAVFNTRAASPTDCTGVMQTIPETNFDADNVSDLMNVRTSVVDKEKNDVYKH